MTDKNIRDLPRTSVVTSSDVIHLNQGGLDRSITTPDFLREVNGGSPFNVTVIEDPSDSRTLSSSDINAYIYFTFQSTAVVTVPVSLSDNMKIGETITIRNDVLGNVVISGEVGVNISQAASGLVLSEIGQVGQILKVGNNSYHFLTGGTATTELTVEGLSFSTVDTLKSRVNVNGATITDWGDFLGQKVSTVVNNTINNDGGSDYIITSVNPGNLSTLVNGIWEGENHDLGGGFYAKNLSPSFFNSSPAKPTNQAIGPYLNLKVKGLARDYGINLFGAEDPTIIDQSAKFLTALNDKYILEIEEGFCGIANIEIPSWVEIHGHGRIRSGLRILGNSNGVLLRRYTKLKDMRIVTSPSQGADKYAVRMGLGNSFDSARSQLLHMTIGGLNTEMGDTVNRKDSCVGIGGGNTFLNKFDTLYVHHVNYGYLNDFNSFGGGRFAGVNNALEWANTEFHRCTIGMQFSRPNGVHLNQVTIENCDKQGLITGTPFNFVMSACYFEANNNSNNGSDGNPKADVLIDSSLVGSGSEPGRSCKIHGINFLSNKSDVLIYATNTLGLDIQGLFDQGTSPGKDLIQIEDGPNGSSGQISDYFSATSRPIINNSSSFFVTDRVKETVSLTAVRGGNGIVHTTRTLASVQEVNLVTISSANVGNNANGSIEQYIVGAWGDGTVNITTVVNSQEVASVGCLVQATGTPYEYEIKNRPAMQTEYRPRIRIERYKR